MTKDDQFSFVRYESDIPGGSVRFFYELTHKEEVFPFAETLTFDPPPKDRLDVISRSLPGVLQNLHLMLGISYWKLFCPSVVNVPYALHREQASFWNTVYIKGLGELFYRNNIDFRGLVNFAHRASKTLRPASAAPIERSLVPMGGGKDSVVTALFLKTHGKPFSLFMLNPNEIHTEVAHTVDGQHISMGRMIDPSLFALNKRSDTYNGHVPISAIYAFTALLAAVLYGYRYIVISNEETASYGNISYLGSEINHQWSKSYEFEKLFSSYTKRFIAQDVEYFSLLRPLTEMKIAQLFSRYPKYFAVATSCNKNFSIKGAALTRRWCGICPKCAFVFLILAAFLPKETAVRMFHKNLFGDSTLLSTYKELLGIEGFKPFECVGTPEESLAAFLAVVNRGEYDNDEVIVALAHTVKLLAAQKGDPTGSVLSVSNNHNIPEPFRHIIASV